MEHLGRAGPAHLKHYNHCNEVTRGAYRVYVLGQLELRLEEEDGHAVSYGARVELRVERKGGNLPVNIIHYKNFRPYRAEILGRWH